MQSNLPINTGVEGKNHSHPIFPGDTSKVVTKTQQQIADIHNFFSLEEQISQLKEMVTQRDLRIQELETALAISQKNATMDPMLNNLLNKGATITALTRRLENGHIKEKYNSILYIDLDFFKQINDKYGHATGDLFLHATANILTKHTREGDIASRLGGEELACTISHDNLSDGKSFAERILSEIRNITVYNSNGDVILNKDTNKPLSITASIGAYTFLSSKDSRSMTTGDMLTFILLKGDMAMYTAKRTGRNQIISWNQEENELLGVTHLEKAILDAQTCIASTPKNQVLHHDDIELVSHIHQEYLEAGVYTEGEII